MFRHSNKSVVLWSIGWRASIFARKSLRPSWTRRRRDADCLDWTKRVLIPARRGDVNRLQRPHTLGLARAGKRPELDCSQRAVTVFIHYYYLSSKGRTSPPFSVRKSTSPFLTKFDNVAKSGMTLLLLPYRRRLGGGMVTANRPACRTCPRLPPRRRRYGFACLPSQALPHYPKFMSADARASTVTAAVRGHTLGRLHTATY